MPSPDALPISRRSLFRLLPSGLFAAPVVVGLSGGLPRAAKAAGAIAEAGGVTKELTPEEKMAMRFPQPVRVSYLIGIPAVDEENELLGPVRRVVRTTTGKIQFIVDYGTWFGSAWCGTGTRLIAVPVEVCAMIGRQVAPIDMPRAEIAKQPDWVRQGEVDLAGGDVIQVAISRR